LEPSKEMLEPSKGTLEPSKEMLEPSKGMLDPSEGMLEPSKGTTEPSEEMLEPSEGMEVLLLPSENGLVLEAGFAKKGTCLKLLLPEN